MSQLSFPALGQLIASITNGGTQPLVPPEFASLNIKPEALRDLQTQVDPLPDSNSTGNPPFSSQELQQLRTQFGSAGASAPPPQSNGPPLPPPTPQGYHTAGLPPVNQSLVASAMAHEGPQGTRTYATLEPDFARRFLGKFSVRNDLTPLMNSLVGNSNLALPDWMIAKDENNLPPVPAASIKGYGQNTPADLAAMPPAIAAAVQARDQKHHADTLLGDRADGKHWYGDSQLGAALTPDQHARAMALEHDEHIERIARRAAMHGHDPLAAQDKRYMGAEQFNAIHAAAEDNRDKRRAAMMAQASPANPLGIPQEAWTAFVFQNPEAASQAIVQAGHDRAMLTTHTPEMQWQRQFEADKKNEALYASMTQELTDQIANEGDPQRKAELQRQLTTLRTSHDPSKVKIPPKPDPQPGWFQTFWKSMMDGAAHGNSAPGAQFPGAA